MIFHNSECITVTEQRVWSNNYLYKIINNGSMSDHMDYCIISEEIDNPLRIIDDDKCDLFHYLKYFDAPISRLTPIVIAMSDRPLYGSGTTKMSDYANFNESEYKKIGSIKDILEKIYIDDYGYDDCEEDWMNFLKEEQITRKIFGRDGIF